jgi:hypothetical protein
VNGHEINELYGGFCMKDANEYYGFTCSLSHFCPRISASVGVSCLPGKKCVSMFFYHIADDPCTARVSFLLLLIAAPHTHILSYNQLYFPPTNYIQFSELPRERFRFRDVSLGHHISFFFSLGKFTCVPIIANRERRGKQNFRWARELF